MAAVALLDMQKCFNYKIWFHMNISKHKVVATCHWYHATVASIGVIISLVDCQTLKLQEQLNQLHHRLKDIVKEGLQHQQGEAVNQIARLVLIMLLKLPISYALEQYSRILPFMLNLCSICKVICSTNSTFYFSYPT